MLPPKHTLLTFRTKVRTYGPRSGCPPWQLVIQAHTSWLAVKETKLYENLTYSPHVARGYHVKITALRIYGTTYARKYYMKNPHSTHLCGARSRSSQLCFFLALKTTTMQDVLVRRPLSAESLLQAKELLPDRSTLVCVAKYVHS